MTSSDVPPQNGVLAPVYRAERWGGMITGQSDVLIDYYVEAVDPAGNATRTEIQHVWVGPGSTGGGPGGTSASLDPDPAVAGSVATLSYDASGGPLGSAGAVFAHVGFDGWTGIITPAPEMVFDASEGVWEVGIAVPSWAGEVNVAFNDGAGTWDNNGGADWSFAVTGGEEPPSWTMDGQLEAGAVEAASGAPGSGMTLWADYAAGRLYLATEAPASGDRFLFVAGTPGLMQQGPWAKGGSVSAWDAFAAREGDNNWSGWFDASGATEIAAAGGGVLEATIDLAGELGSVPEGVWIAAAWYGTSDGSGLIDQAPVSVDADGDVDAAEWFYLDLARFNPPPACPGDTNGDGATDVTDFFALAGSFGTPSGATLADGDVTGDGAVDVSDFFVVAGDFGCPQG